MANSHGSDASTRRNRYTRSSTSVTQLLSDSCSSLIQRLTTRVRGPSATLERSLQNNNNTTSSTPKINPLQNSHSLANITSNRSRAEEKANLAASNSTRSRLEDKYTSVLEKLYGRKKDTDVSSGRALGKSATTSQVNVLLSEKPYSLVSSNAPREKTPYRGDGKLTQRKQYPEPPYSYLDRDSAYRVRHRSNHSELRPRRSAKPQRTGKSEYAERKNSTKLCPVEIPPIDDVPSTKVKTPKPIYGHDDDATPTPSIPDPISEREAKRKEIQSLIMKYSALDDVYNRATTAKTPQNKTLPESTESFQSQKNALVPILNANPPVLSAASSIAQKYHHTRLTSAVSSGRGL